jgi:hypothetical protein
MKNTNKFILTSCALLFCAHSNASDVEVPTTFVSGTVANAGEVNGNFDALAAGINDNNAKADTNALGVSTNKDGIETIAGAVVIIGESLLSAVTGLETQTFKSTSLGYSGGANVSDSLIATCPTGSIMTGGGVWCQAGGLEDWNTTNFGVVNASNPAGNSYIGSCAADAITFNSGKFGPPVEVFVTCLSFSAPQAKASAKSTKLTADSPQGEPSPEALLMTESIKAMQSARAVN